ncbi:xylulokinase [Actinocatenispora rupis]|uniref:xylulokinase n=1 Tax=Actinocatenispora rupis TaxID=519421 RepID=UPI0031E68D5C
MDVGTTGLKAVVVDDGGRLVRDAAVRYPTALAGLGAEQDATAWWSAATAALRRIVRPGEPVAGIAVTSQGPTMVPVDAAGTPLAPALTWADRRATAESADLAAALPPGRNGTDPYFGTAKLLWWSRRGALTDAHAVLCANAFVVRRLTGMDSLDESTASFFTGWDSGFADPVRAAGVPVELLGDAVTCTTVVGTVTADAAAATGLPAGTPVAAGAIDAVGAALEAGLLTPGDGVAEMTGFSTVSLRPVPRGTHVPGMIHVRHCVPGTDLLLTAQVSTGALVDWVARVTGYDAADVLDAEVPAERPGRLALLPSLLGERTPVWDPGARGAIVGLDLDVTAGDLLLAAYEGTALALRADLAAVDAVLGAGRPLAALGGGARSRHWPQVKADVLGREVRVPVAGHGAAHGAALLAGVATGVWPDFAAVAPTGRRTATTFAPDPDRHAAYGERLGAVQALRDHLAGPTGLTDILRRTAAPRPPRRTR